MADQAVIPSVADIAPVQQVTSTAGNDSVLQGLSEKLNAPLPSPYTTGVQQAQPTVPTVRQFQPQSTNNQPMNNTATSIKNARQKNNFASIGNIIGQVTNMYQQQKNTTLRNNITSVMKAKQNVENAQKVLSTPGIDAATKQQAQTVLDANKKQMQALFADPKNRKSLEKAFDISYVDMDKNKTPEVAQAIAAKKEVDKAGALNYNNPQELAVAKAAGDPTLFKGANELGGGGAPAPKKNELGANLPAQSAQAIEPKAKSTTPYADAALAKDMPTMENNPQYAAALAQKEAARKQYMAALPSIVKADSAASLANAKAGNAQELAKFKATNDLAKQKMQDAEKLAGIDKETAARVKVAAMQDATRMAETTAKINSLEKIAANRNLTAENIAGVKKQSADLIQTEVNKATTDLNASSAAVLTAKNLPEGPAKDKALAEAENDKTSAQRYLTYWQRTMDDKIGTPAASPTATKSAEQEKTGTLGNAMKAIFGIGPVSEAGQQGLGLGSKNAGSSTATQPDTPSAQRTDPTDAEKATAIKYAQEVGPTDDSSALESEPDENPDEYGK